MVKTMVKEFLGMLKTLENIGITALFREDGSTPAVSIVQFHEISNAVKPLGIQGVFHFVVFNEWQLISTNGN